MIQTWHSRGSRIVEDLQPKIVNDYFQHFALRMRASKWNFLLHSELQRSWSEYLLAPLFIIEYLLWDCYKIWKDPNLCYSIINFDFPLGREAARSLRNRKGWTPRNASQRQVVRDVSVLGKFTTSTCAMEFYFQRSEYFVLRTWYGTGVESSL